MNDKLHIIQHLYGEADALLDQERLLEDEALRVEYEMLSGVKFHLDQRPKQRPDAAVLDTVLAAAAKASGRPLLQARQDRKPQSRHAARRYGLFGTVSAVVVVLMVASIGLYQMQQEGLIQVPPTESAISEEAEVMTDQAAPLAEQKEREATDAHAPSPVARLEPEPTPERPDASASRERAMAQPAAPMAIQPEAAGLGAAKTEVDTALADDADAEESVPAWDESDALLRVHRQLEMVETRSPEFAWGDSAVMSLDVLPTNPQGRDTVTPVSTRRGNH
jgi:hypothetical protein